MVCAARFVLFTAGALLVTSFMTPEFSVRADPSQFPRPPSLEPDVQFWERIYSRVTTHGGLLHDDRNLGVVYEELNFPPGLTSRERSNLVDTVRAHYERVLKRLATGERSDLSDDEKRVLSLFPPETSNTTLAEAAEHVRFQLGQADRFREGVIRSGAWKTHVEETLRREGIPDELSALPHVESSFNPRAYSKVGAAGLWQFMRGTGKRWLRVDATVDERLDPYKSTLAAAQFLNINYSILGTWPLALTAWNHGAGGMRKAKEELGTDDITTIIRQYQGRTFGFASRNFYVSFLAALEVDRNAEKFFGRLDRQPHDESRTIRLPALMPAQALEKTLGTDRDTLRALNLALLDPVWSGKRPVPRGYELRVPLGVDTGRLLARLGQAGRDDVVREKTVTVAKGDTLDRIATQYGIRTRELANYNSLESFAVRPGQVLRIPAVNSNKSDNAAAPVPPAAAIEPELPAQSDSRSNGHVVGKGETLSAIARRYGVTADQLMRLNELPNQSVLREGRLLKVPPAAVTDKQVPSTESESPSDEVPAIASSAESALPTDPADYSVTAGLITVQAAETIAQLARWAGLSATQLAALNQLKLSDNLLLGRRLKIDLVGVDAAGFEARRVAYHRELEAAYFTKHRITGTQRYRVEKGDTLWTLTQHGKVPLWLLRQYNPDSDFTSAKPGKDIIIPVVEVVEPEPGEAAVRVNPS